MKSQRFVMYLTAVNLLLFASNLLHARPTAAGDVAPVLRGRSLEIVDDRGRVRASIKIHPEDPSMKMPNGRTGYPETVMFRLHDAKGRPEVKLGASERGAGLGLLGATDETRIHLLAEDAGSEVSVMASGKSPGVLKPSH